MESLLHLELLLQAVHLGPQGVDDVLPVHQHEVLQLLRSLHLLDVLHTNTEKSKIALKLMATSILMPLESQLWR